MACKSCCDEPSQIVIERVVKAIINQMILDGELQPGLKDCAGIMLAAGQRVATCEELDCAKLKCEGNGGGNTVDIYLNKAELQGNTLVLTMNNNVVHNVDLSNLAGGQGADNYLASAALNGTSLALRMKDGSTISVDLAPLVQAAADDYVAGAAYDPVKGLVLTRKGGEEVTTKLPVVKDVTFVEGTRLLTLELDDGTNKTVVIPAGPSTGGTDNDTVIAKTELVGTELVITMSDGAEHKTDVSSLKDTDTNTKNQTLTLQGTELVLTDTDNQEVKVDLAGLKGTDTNTKNQSLVLNNNELVLTDTDNQEVKVDLSGLIPQAAQDKFVQALANEHVNVDTGNVRPNGTKVLIPSTKVTLTLNDNTKLDTTFGSRITRVNGVGVVTPPVVNPGTGLMNWANLRVTEYSDDSAFAQNVDLPTYWTIPDLQGNKLKLTTMQRTKGFTNDLNDPNEGVRVEKVFEKEIDLAGLTGAGPDGNKYIREITTSRQLKPTGQNTVHGAPINTFINRWNFRYTDDTNVAVDVPDYTFEIDGVGASLPISIPEQPNLQAGASIFFTHKYDGQITSSSAMLPTYWVEPKLVGNTLTLETKVHTGLVVDHGTHPDIPAAVKTVYTQDIQLPTGGAAPTYTGSSETAATTTGTDLPTTVAGADRSMLLGKPYKWVEITVDGEVCLMPVFKKV